MNTQEAERLLKQINAIKYPKRVGRRHRKRRNETDRDYVLRLNGFRCRYTKRILPKEKLSVVTLYPNRTDIPKWKNLGCAWTEYATIKGNLDEDEFLKVLAARKKQIKKEANRKKRKIKKVVFARHNFKCVYCEIEYGHTPSDRKLTLDHKIPIGKGGTNDIDRNYKNLTSSCQEHNFEKGIMTASEYIKKITERKINKRVTN